jgi:flavin reductase (DIM6/NTAB) family NADH-FMN oxidoreductase RutF
MSCQMFPQTADLNSVGAAEFRRAMSYLAGGVAIVTTGADSGRRGLTVSSVTSLCMEPPCLLVGINSSSETHDAILANGHFAVNLLGNGQQNLALRFAGRDGAKGIQRFETAPWDQGLLGRPCSEMPSQRSNARSISIRRSVRTASSSAESWRHEAVTAIL